MSAENIPMQYRSNTRPRFELDDEALLGLTLFTLVLAVAHALM
jgi:hypothetical protein